MVTFLFEGEKKYVLINTAETLTKQTYKVTSTFKKNATKVLLYNSYNLFSLYNI